MAVAVNGMHYTGMAAATFTYVPNRLANEDHDLVSVETALEGAIYGAALFISFVFVIAVADLRRVTTQLVTRISV
jgi:NO-binding membrane sensor protein with MHYT domain